MLPHSGDIDADASDDVALAVAAHRSTGPSPSVEDEADRAMLMSGEEALRRLAMLQMSLQFMLWQQNRRRWEGIVMSAMAYMEGIDDVCAAFLPPHSIQSTDTAMESLRLVDAEQQWATPTPSSSSSNYRLAIYVDNMGRASFCDDTHCATTLRATEHHHRWKSLILALPSRKVRHADTPEALPPCSVLPTCEDPHAVATSTCAQGVAVPCPMGDVGALPLLPLLPEKPRLLLLPPPSTGALHRHPVTRQVTSSKVDRTSTTTGLDAARRSAPWARHRADLTDHEALVVGMQRLDVLCTTFDKLAACGLPIRPVFAEAIVDCLLTHRGGYEALTRRQRLLSCEFGLSDYIVRCKGQWRRQQQQGQPLTAAALPPPRAANCCHLATDGGASTPTTTQRALMLGIERATTWADASLWWRQLLRTFPLVATDRRTLRLLGQRFDAAVVYSDRHVRAAMRDVEEGWGDDSGEPQRQAHPQPTSALAPRTKGNVKHLSKLQRSLKQLHGKR